MSNNNFLAGLDYFFKPRNVALIGASDKLHSVGKSTYENLIHGGFKGEIFAVNPSHLTVLGRKSYPDIKLILDLIDLAIIEVPAKNVAEVLKDCIACNVPAAIIISAGFKESGCEGQQLEAEIKSIAAGKIRLIGPNCLGLMNPKNGLNASFAQQIAKPGHTAFLSQSGALCTAILDWSLQEDFGFSAFVSTGSMADVGWGELIRYFGKDENTKSIVIYMESIGDADSFMSAAAEVTQKKPILVIKAGRTAAAARAAASHTGALTGSDAVLDAAFERCGVLRVQEISELFYVAHSLERQPSPLGRKLCIITNAGGPAVLATDALVTGGGELAELSSDSIKYLNQRLPTAWSHANPIDILGDADPDRFAAALTQAQSDTESDAILIITTPQGVTNPTEIALKIAEVAKGCKKPIFASWMGGAMVAEAIQILNRAGIPTFPYPDAAAKAFNSICQAVLNNSLLTPPQTSFKDFISSSIQDQVTDKLRQIQKSGRTILTEFESKNIFANYEIPTVPTKIARSMDEASIHAKNLGFPVVLKLHSETITHKTDVGGVYLDLKNEGEVCEAWLQIEKNVSLKASPQDFLGVTVQPMIHQVGYELILGCSTDAQFGPVLLFGSGGQLVEVLKDQALALPLTTMAQAQGLIEKTKIYKALLGIRGRPPVPLEQLKQLMLRFSALIQNHPQIAEIEINPLLASENGFMALDARVVLQKHAVNNPPALSHE